jgi:hypothetical protein
MSCFWSCSLRDLGGVFTFFKRFFGVFALHFVFFECSLHDLGGVFTLILVYILCFLCIFCRFVM